jgi:hypothetical protein
VTVDSVIDPIFEGIPRFMEVSPTLARQWLEHNTCNRPLKPERIEAYARDMAAGEWRITGEMFKFATDGRMLDGHEPLPRDHHLWCHDQVMGHVRTGPFCAGRDGPGSKALQC